MVAPPDSAAEPTLQPDAVGFLDTLVIGLASTSPAYSLAAVLGPVVALVGVHAPGVLLASLVPMLLIAGAFAALNRADPDCGTTESGVVVPALTVALILLMAAICVRGTEVSARLQNGLIVAQTLALAVFAVVALARGSLAPS